mgnify:CR=1 FL=1
MNGKDNAFLWACQDNSDGECLTEKFGIRLKDAEEAKDFQSHFEAAQLFNVKAKKGDTDIVLAPKVEDIKEVMDNPDENIHHEEGDD